MAYHCIADSRLSFSASFDLPYSRSHTRTRPLPYHVATYLATTYDMLFHAIHDGTGSGR
jgi:hypothetical protein